LARQLALVSAAAVVPERAAMRPNVSPGATEYKNQSLRTEQLGRNTAVGACVEVAAAVVGATVTVRASMKTGAGVGSVVGVAVGSGVPSEHPISSSANARSGKILLIVPPSV